MTGCAISRVDGKRTCVPDVLLTAIDRCSAVSDRVGENGCEVRMVELEAVLGEGVGYDPC